MWSCSRGPLHARLIARATGCDVKCVHRQLARLARQGVVSSRDAGKEKWYRLRRDFHLGNVFEEFFQNTTKLRRYPGLETKDDLMDILEDLMDEG